MTKRDYIFFHLVCVVKIQQNENAKKQIEKNLQVFSDEDIDRYYIAVTGSNRNKLDNSKDLKDLYSVVFNDVVESELTPSQQACLCQAGFEYKNLIFGYIERDQYKDINIVKGKLLYALVGDPKSKEIPKYLFDKDDFQVIKTATTMDVYAFLQLDPYWSGGYGARTVINEYIVVDEFVGAQGYALNNHHLSRETRSLEPLSEKDKIEKGVGNYHIECEPYDEYDIEYKYILPPCRQIFIPKKYRNLIVLNNENVCYLKDNMKDYKDLYEKLVTEAQENELKYLYDIYVQNKRLDKELPEIRF